MKPLTAVRAAAARLARGAEPVQVQKVREQRDDQIRINGSLAAALTQRDARIKELKADRHLRDNLVIAAMRMTGQAQADARRARAELAAAQDTIARQDAHLTRLTHASVLRTVEPDGGEAA